MKSLPYTIIDRPEWQTAKVEDVWVSLKPNNKSKVIHLCCVYLPGEMDTTTFEGFIENATARVNENPDDDFIILGDFNVPSFSPIQALPKVAKAILVDDLIDCSGLEQLNTIRSHAASKNLLDLVLSNSCLTIELCEEPLLNIDEFHPPILISSNNILPAIFPVFTSFRNFKRVNWLELNSDLMKINWIAKFSTEKTVDGKVGRFYEAIQEVLDTQCPLIKKKLHASSWLSRHTVNLLSRKRIHHKKWKLHGNKRDYEIFSELRREARASVEEDFKKHHEKAELEIKTNPKSFWKFINSRKDDGAGIASYLRLGEKVAFDKKKAADLLAEHFKSVYSTDQDLTSINEPLHTKPGTWNKIEVSMDTIFQKLKNLDSNKATGPDKLPPKLFKNCSISLTFPLFYLFNESLKSGIFPMQWKLALVAPIHKSGSIHDATNYRPISKLSIIAKILDNIVTDEVFEKFKRVIIPQQHGFFPKRSTVTNLLNYTETLQKCVDQGGQTDVVYTDFAKAFDKVNHNKLLEKLHAHGISGSLLKWFESYLKERSQIVQVGESLSFTINVSSSIVQGSHLGPLLFSIFINDVGKILRDVEFCIYADDLKIFKEIRKQEDARILQENIERLAVYVLENHLALNVKKCVVASYTKNMCGFFFYQYNINGETLDRQNPLRDLGILYDGKLNFNAHVDAVCKKAKQMLGFIMRVGKYFKDPRTFVTLYCSLVRSHLEYGSIIWNPHTSSQKQQVERIQHKFLRHIAWKFFQQSDTNLDYFNIEQRLKIDNLELRRIFADVKFVSKSYTNYVDNETFKQNFRLTNPQRTTRSDDVFQIATRRTDVGKFSVVNRLMSNFNQYCNKKDILDTKPDDFGLITTLIRTCFHNGQL